MNNFEYIKSMDFDEMQSFIIGLTRDREICDVCKQNSCEYFECVEGVKQWLQSDIEKPLQQEAATVENVNNEIE